MTTKTAELAALTLSHQKTSSELDNCKKKLKDSTEEMTKQTQDMNKVSKLLDETKV